MDPLSVTVARFERLPEPVGDYQLSVRVAGSGFIDRAAPLLAAVGDVPVREIMVGSEGAGFTGFLEREPAAGDRLVVRYADTPPVDTEVTYPGEPDPAPEIPWEEPELDPVDADERDVYVPEDPADPEEPIA